MAQGRDITLFTGYSQKENRTTNYCLLLLRMLYEENPKFLDEALDAFTGGRTGGQIGVQFRQQVRRTSSIPDGVILQPPFTLYLETKNFDWFYDDQIERHLQALSEEPGLKVLIALANFEALSDSRFSRIQQLCDARYRGQIVFSPGTFEGFLAAVKRPGLSKNLSDAVDDFERYLDEENLLPRWKQQMDVCNCAGLADVQLVHGTYICPAKGGAYSHARSRFFGMYRNKQVEKVAEIHGVVDIEPGPDGAAQVLWNNVPTERSNADLIREAQAKMQTVHPNAEWPGRVFVLGPLRDTSFQKDSSGGMQGSKQYFDVSRLEADSAEQLAESLRSMKWSQLL